MDAKIPTFRKGFKASACGKCGGTGLYATHIENGVAVNACGTGLDCWRCGGAGYTYRKSAKGVAVLSVELLSVRITNGVAQVVALAQTAQGPLKVKVSAPATWTETQVKQGVIAICA